MGTALLNASFVAESTESGAWQDNFIDAYLTDAAQAVPDRPAVVDRGRTWTYAEFDAIVDALGAALQRHGVGHGDVVSWQLPNWAEACAVHLAAIRIGAISNPIMPIYRHSETRFILEQAKSKIAFIPGTFRNFDFPEMFAEISTGLSELETVVVLGSAQRDHEVSFEDFLDGFHGRRPEPVTRDANDLVLLLYTSGTTSAPKGALHTHNTLDYENRSIIELLGLTQDDVVFMPSPVGHITGILYGIQMPPMLRSGVVLLDIWEPTAGLELIQKHQCAFMIAATPFLHGLVHHPSLGDYDVSSLRNFLCGGADVPPDLIVNATTALDCCMVARVYGSTEYPTATSGSTADPLQKRANTDGRAIGQARIRIVDDHENDLDSGEDGELLARGPEMFVGYLDAELNKSAFTDDGWFRTGDLGRIDADGHLEITGRKKDIIIRGGENLSAKEVEDHLFAHPKVAEVAIVGSPDPVLGERVCAVVVPEPDVAVELAELIEWLLERKIAKQKLPESLIVLDQMPRTASGKIQKFKLRDLANGRVGEKASS
jgi:cyclohexanecarboxylate-CoA ligase